MLDQRALENEATLPTGRPPPPTVQGKSEADVEFYIFEAWCATSNVRKLLPPDHDARTTLHNTYYDGIRPATDAVANEVNCRQR
eukprot:6151294-Pyramimonas_sp.AAC.1